MLDKLLARLPTRFLQWLVDTAERRAIRKLGGIPILWVIYKPWEPEPNIYFHTHGVDKRLDGLMQQMAEHIRANYEGGNNG